MNGTPTGHGLYYISEFPTSDFFFTFTVDADVVFQYFFLDVQNGATVNNVVSIQIEEGSTATDWSPYSNICPISGRTGVNVYVGPTQDPDDATTYSVDWTDEAGTVYGGTLDVVTGLLTVDRATVTLNGSETWGAGYPISGQGCYTALHSLKKLTDYKSAISCNELKTYASYNEREYIDAEYGISGYRDSLNTHPGQNWLYIKINELSTTNEYKTWLASNNLQVVYPLATPLTYQLTPQEVQMLLGENYVWSSSGDTVSVTYYAEGNANPLQSLNILLGGNYSNPKTADDVSDKEALEIILGGNK